MNQQTIDMLTEMKMTAMAAEFANQIQDVSFNSIGFEERLSMLVTAEWNRRQNNKIARLMHNAEFGIPSAAMEEIEYHEDRKLDKAQLLRLASCKYIDEGHHVVLEGASGNGKTYIACALGNAACRHMKTVRYIRMPELLDELNIARSNGSLKKLMKAYKKVELLKHSTLDSLEIILQCKVQNRTLMDFIAPQPLPCADMIGKLRYQK